MLSRSILLVIKNNCFFLYFKMLLCFKNCRICYWKSEIQRDRSVFSLCRNLIFFKSCHYYILKSYFIPLLAKTHWSNLASPTLTLHNHYCPILMHPVVCTTYFFSKKDMHSSSPTIPIFMTSLYPMQSQIVTKTEIP